MQRCLLFHRVVRSAATLLLGAVMSAADAFGQEIPGAPAAPGPGAERSLAREHPGDRGIADHPDVVFAENFESDSLEATGRRWEMVRNPEVMSLSDDVPPGSSGRRSLLMSQQRQLGTGGDLFRRLGDGHDRLYVRMYVKFAADCEPIHHFGTCVGGNRPSNPWPSVRAGQPTAGDRGFWLGIEPFGRSWTWDYYVYWHEMRGSPPRGQTWGNSFIHSPTLKVRRGEWTCVETLVKLNRPDQHDGELALWIDGRPVSHLGPGFPRGKWVFDKFLPGQSGEGVRWNHHRGDREHFTTAPGGDPFEGFQFRTTDELKLSFLWLYVYITEASAGQVNRVWFDDVVVARRYIGPLHPVDRNQSARPAP